MCHEKNLRSPLSHTRTYGTMDAPSAPRQLRQRKSTPGSPFSSTSHVTTRRRKPTCEPYNYGQLIDEHNTNNHWELHPDIQRYDDTWDADMKNTFMDSVFEGLATQTIFVVSENTENGTQRVIEGAHRRRTLLEYVGWYGEEFTFPYRPTSDPTKEFWWHDMPENDKNKLRASLFMKTTYYDLTEEEEILLFNRMNTSLPLQIGELINSHRDIPLCHLASEIADVKDVKVVMNKCRTGLAGGIARMADKAVIFQVVYNFYVWCYVEKDPVNMLKNSHVITESVNPKRFDAACKVMQKGHWNITPEFEQWAFEHVINLMKCQHFERDFRPAQLWLSQLMMFTKKFTPENIKKLNEKIASQQKVYTDAKKKNLRRLPPYVFSTCESQTHPCAPKNLLPKLEQLIAIDSF